MNPKSPPNDGVVRRELQALENPPKPLPPIRRITSIRKGLGGETFKTVKTVIYLPDNSSSA